MHLADSQYAAELDGLSSSRQRKPEIAPSAGLSAGSAVGKPLTVYPDADPRCVDWPMVITDIMRRVAKTTGDAILGALTTAEVVALAVVESRLQPDVVVAETKGRASYGLFQMLDQTAARMWAARSLLGPDASHMGQWPGSTNPRELKPLLTGETNIWYAAVLLLHFSEWARRVAVDPLAASWTPQPGHADLCARLNEAARAYGLRPLALALRLFWRASSSAGIHRQFVSGEAAVHGPLYAAAILRAQASPP